MCTKGERRKKTFSKAKRNAKLFEKVTGTESYDIGRYKKHKHLNTKSDAIRTNSEWHGKRNYKHSEKKRFEKLEAELKDNGLICE